MKYEKKEWLCARCANQCKADGGMDYCEKFIDKEEAERIANAKKIAEICERCTLKCANVDCEAIRKRFEKLMRAIQDFANVFNKD